MIPKFSIKSALHEMSEVSLNLLESKYVVSCKCGWTTSQLFTPGSMVNSRAARNAVHRQACQHLARNIKASEQL